MIEALEGNLSSRGLFTTFGGVYAANYLVGSHARQYRLIMDVLTNQREVPPTGMGYDELAELIRMWLPQGTAVELVEDPNLFDRLASLVSRGTYEAWQNRATTEEESLRNRYRCQLIETRAVLNQVVKVIEGDLGADLTAVLLVPTVLADRPRVALGVLAGERIDDTFREFSVIETIPDIMARGANQWRSRTVVVPGGVFDQARITHPLEIILAHIDAQGAGVDAWFGRTTICLPDLKATDPDI